MLSCAHWLNWQCGISLGAAREKVRVAHALAGLPAVSAAFAQGTLSYSKARAMTRVATLENEAGLVNIALHGTAAHMEKLVRCYRRVRAGETLEQAQWQHQARALHYHFDEGGSLVLQARFTPEQGVVVLNAIQAALDVFDGDVSDVAEESDDEITPAKISAETPADIDQAEDTPCHQRADAWVRLAEAALGSDMVPATGAERYQVMLHLPQRGENTNRPMRHRGCSLGDGRAIAIGMAKTWTMALPYTDCWIVMGWSEMARPPCHL